MYLREDRDIRLEFRGGRSLREKGVLGERDETRPQNSLRINLRPVLREKGSSLHSYSYQTGTARIYSGKCRLMR